jgi:H+/Cl- antiporter ClcA
MKNTIHDIPALIAVTIYAAITTISGSHAANKNLTNFFQNWRRQLSANALTAAQQYP